MLLTASSSNSICFRRVIYALQVEPNCLTTQVIWILTAEPINMQLLGFNGSSHDIHFFSQMFYDCLNHETISRFLHYVLFQELRNKFGVMLDRWSRAFPKSSFYRRVLGEWLPSLRLIEAIEKCTQDVLATVRKGYHIWQLFAFFYFSAVILFLMRKILYYFLIDTYFECFIPWLDWKLFSYLIQSS